MKHRDSRIDTGVSVSFIASALIHLAVFLLLAWWGRLYPPQMAIQETYYVDVVNLPVANPRAGVAAQKPAEAKAAPPSATPPQMSMPHPAKPVSISAAKSKPVIPKAAPEPAETEAAFNERMAKLERKGEARHEEDVLESIARKLKGKGNPQIGTPGTSGTEAGSRYSDFIKSRLEDALKITSFYTTRNPEVVVRLAISPDGRISKLTIEHSSGDRAFELAVRRAIDLASEKFTAPPNHTVFENGFVFRPKNISNRPSR